MEVRLIVANQNQTQIQAIVYKQKPSLYIFNLLFHSSRLASFAVTKRNGEIALSLQISSDNCPLLNGKKV